MTPPRHKIVVPEVTQWYHTITRCVRKSFLLRKKKAGINRKEWLKNRLQELTKIFAISVGSFSIMDNHLHVVVRLDIDEGEQWSDREVAFRWSQLCPPKDRTRKPIASLETWLNEKIADAPWIARIRSRLQSISWFMKYFKEPFSRIVNKEENRKGTLFEARFKSIAILDDDALLSTNAYVDLNPVAARLAETPEASSYTSIKERVDNVVTSGREKDIELAKIGSVPCSLSSSKIEDPLWLLPIEDRRDIDSDRRGMLPGFTLGNYLLLIDHTSRRLRKGKSSISKELAPIFDRIQCDPDSWAIRMKNLLSRRQFGNFAAGTKTSIAALTQRIGVKKVVNVLR